MEDVPDYEGLYQISNLGNVKSLKREVYDKFGKKYNKKERILKPGLSTGYFTINLCKNGVSKNYMIHKLVIESFIPNPENKPCVNHINGIKTDNRLENLEWVTYSENTKHAFKIGLQIPSKRVGENHNRSKLTNESVLYIRKHSSNVESIKNLTQRS